MSRITLRLGQNSALNDDIDDEETQLTDTQEDEIEIGQSSIELETQNYSQPTQMNDQLDSELAVKSVSQVKLVIFIEALVRKE